MIEIAEEQVDKVWEEALLINYLEASGMLYALELLKITSCELCHGTGDRGKCPQCGSHGWVHNE